MADVTKEIGHIGTVQVPVTVTNRGATSITRDVTLDVNGTTVDTQSVSLNVDNSTTVTLTDSSFGQSDIGVTRSYTVSTGGVEPDIDAEIIGALLVKGSPAIEIPTTDTNEIQYELSGELHFDTGDELKLDTTSTNNITLPGPPPTEVPSFDVREVRNEQGNLHFDQGDKLNLSQ